MTDELIINEIYSRFTPHAGASIDSRSVARGALFFGLPGERKNGGEFAEQALAAGASCAVVDLARMRGKQGVIVVPDVRAALQGVAQLHRASLRVPVVAVTGSNGKTTTRSLMVAALGAKYQVRGTQGNLNNELGVPLTLLSICPEDEIAVVEMGANHVGEIAQLCRIANPTHGVITSIGEAHLEGFGSVEGVMRAKGELFAHLHATGGTAFVRDDDARVTSIAEQVHMGCSASRYSLAMYHARWEETSPGQSLLHVMWQGQEYHVAVHLAGSYNAINAVAALHIAHFFNVPLHQAAAGIGGYIPTNHRSQVKEGERNRLFLDCYNANPSSMALAIADFSRRSSTRPRVMILGEMRELGQESRGLHARIAQQAAESGAEQCYFVGVEWTGVVPEEQHFNDCQAYAEYLGSHPLTGYDVLLKGSHGVALEQLEPYLL